MTYEELIQTLKNFQNNSGENEFFNLAFDDIELVIYTNSVKYEDDHILLVPKDYPGFSFLVLINKNIQSQIEYEGEDSDINGEIILRRCTLNKQNVKVLFKNYNFLRPKLVGLRNSFGFGDRLGIANVGHLKSLKEFDFIPVLAQQSIRELNRTNRKPAEVLHAAIYACLITGYTKGFGADADHLKTIDHLQLMIDEGYTFFTFDPGEHVNNNADSLNENKINEELKEFHWDNYGLSFNEIKKLYCNGEITFNDGSKLNVTEVELKSAIIKYGNAILHIRRMYEHLKMNKSDPFEVEISVDETESITSVFEHFFISDQLHRFGVKYISLAPRFIGDFEKGIDYKGDIKLFESELIKHKEVMDYFGDYKLSLHSGSDKFKIYEILAKHNVPVHIKTAGTSYLEALRTIAHINPSLFREIWDYSVSCYEQEKKTYHVSANISLVKDGNKYSDEELTKLLDDDNARQILHVTYGRILSDKNSDGKFIFKDRLLDSLKASQRLYDEYLQKHFMKHMMPFKN